MGKEVGCGHTEGEGWGVVTEGERWVWSFGKACEKGKVSPSCHMEKEVEGVRGGGGERWRG